MAELSLSPELLERAMGVGVLLWLRIAPMTLLLAGLAFPARATFIAATLSLVTSLCLWPVAMLGSPRLPTGALAMAALALREVLCGGVLGLAVAGPVLALRWAGAIADRLLHADDAQVPGSPHAFESPGPIATLYMGCALVLLFTMDGHRGVLEVLGEHLIRTPVGHLTPLNELGPTLLSGARLLGDALLLAVSLAGPVMVAALVLELVAGLMTRLGAGTASPTTTLSLRRLALIGTIMLGAPMLMGRLPDLLRAALERAGNIL